MIEFLIGVTITVLLGVLTMAIIAYVDKKEKSENENKEVKKKPKKKKRRRKRKLTP